MTKFSDRQLLQQLSGSAKHYDQFNADDVVPGAPNITRMAALKGNPPFIGQFNIDVFIDYYTVAAGVFTQRTAAYVLANAPTLATRLGVFFFSQADYYGSGFANAKTQFPLSVWAYGVPFTYGKDYPITAAGVIDATVEANLAAGDVVIPFSATVAGPVTYVATVILRAQEVQYGNLLTSLNSDMFTINNIRYTLTDTSTTGLTQYRNIFYLLTQSFLGSFKSDKIPVNAMKNPEQFQAGIVDIPIEKAVDKNIGFGSYLNYDQTDSVSLGFFLSGINKLAA